MFATTQSLGKKLCCFGVGLVLSSSVVFGEVQGGGTPAAVPTPGPAAELPSPTPTPFVDIEKLPWKEDRPPLPWEETFRVHRSVVTPVGLGRVKIGPFGGPTMNVIAEEGEYLVVRMAPPEDPASPYHKAWLYHSLQEARLLAQEQLLAQRYFVADKPPVIPPFTDRLRFELWSKGLPQGGEWQLSGDVADFNGDGRLDLVLPPPRGGKATPTIYLNLGNGEWRAWGEQRYPSNLPFDYGSVRVADFNRDGFLDLALACHFKGFFVLYGDGRGSFEKWQQLQTLVGGVTSKILEVADFDHDGRPDIASVAEIDLNMTSFQRYAKGLVEVFLNRESGWVPVDGRFPERLFGDSLALGDLDRDGFADLVVGSSSQGMDRLFYLNRERGVRWDAFALDQVPYNSFVNSVAVGPLAQGSKTETVAVLCFEQVNPLVQEDPTLGCAIYSFWEHGKFLYEPSVKLLFSEKRGYSRYQGVAMGDVDGDRRTDIVVGDTTGTVRVFLQGARGEFYENQSRISVDGKVMSLRLADLDGDGRCEVIVMATPRTPGVGGGVWVFRLVNAPRG